MHTKTETQIEKDMELSSLKCGADASQNPTMMSSPSRMSAGSAGNGVGGAASGRPMQMVDTAVGAILARPDKPFPCSACGTGFDISCEIGARAMLKVANTKTCTVHSQEECASLLNEIEENNVLFQNCSCEPPKWAMNWQGRNLDKKYSRWGAFHSLCRVRRDFRGKKPVKRLLEDHQSCLSSSSAGSKRTSDDVGETLEDAKQCEPEARPTPRMKLKPNPVAVPIPE